MTALLGAILFLAFLTEGVTILSVNQLFAWHVFIGLFIVPLVCVKLATTGYRSVNYYRGDLAYRRKGAIHVLGHALETWRLTKADVRSNPPLARRGARTAVVACGLVAGLILGVASLGWTDAWKGRERRRDGAPSVVVRPDLVEYDDALG